MRSLGEFAEPDGLSQLLLRLTVSSTVNCLSHMSSPWGLKVAARSRPRSICAYRKANAAR